MNSLLFIANILYPIVAVVSILMITNRDRRGFLTFIIVEVLMFYIGLMSAQWGISIMALIYTVVNIHGYIKWGKVA